MDADDGSALPLHEGRSGGAVLDLQLRLAELDLASTDPPGSFGPATREAVAMFQERRSLPVDGTCDRRTWSALVEAGYHLGDRLLYRRQPMLRGDDVADLQRRLSALGFDPGRIDAIFGDQTVTAVMDFQRNAGLPVDGICGRAVLADLVRLQVREGGGDLVSSLHERLRIESAGSRTLDKRQIAVGEHGGFAVGVVSVCRLVREVGATALSLHDPDPSRQAAAANAAGVDCFVSLRILPDRASCTTAYYRGFEWESTTSRHLAELVQGELPGCLGLEDGGTIGIALPILRETRMPAIEIQLGSPSVVVQRTTELAQVLVKALGCWIEASFD